MTEHISKITERYIKMTYSKHKIIEYRGDENSKIADEIEK
jgi:hypothetical protein